jgi:hypothetical protein
MSNDDVMAAPSRLTAARLQLHYAIQPLASASAALCSTADEGSRGALLWDSAGRRMQTPWIPGETPLRITLEPVDLRCSLIDVAGRELASLDLARRRVGEAFDWLRAALDSLDRKGEEVVPLAHPSDDFPFHTIALGDPFPSDGREERGLLASLYHRSAEALAAVLSDSNQEAPLRLWPHHFDLARLLSFSGGRSVGLGFSPGDRSYAEPYWYVAPWPTPAELPSLAVGTWHTDGWTGEIQRLSDAGEALPDPGPFLRQAFEVACRALKVPSG